MTIRDELLALQQASHGLLRVEDAVNWAERHAGSDLHGALEWDNERAGHAYRCQQMRQLIRIHVVNIDGVREMISLTVDRGRPGGGYRETDTVLSAQWMRGIAVYDLLVEFERLCARAHGMGLREFRDICKEVRKLRLLLDTKRTGTI